MSLTIPLAVQLSTSRGTRHITSEVRDLVLRWTDPGGFSSCQVALDRPLSRQPDEIALYGGLTVYDARNGSVAWDGRVTDQGRSAGSDGQVWQLAAVGGQAHTQDRTVPYVVIDSAPEYERVDNATAGAQDSVGASPGDSAGADQHLILTFPNGLAVTTNSRVVLRYNRIWRADQDLSRISYTWDAGVTDTNHSVQAVTRTAGSLAGGEIAETATLNTAGGSGTALITTDWPAGRDTVELRQIRTAGGASTIPSDNYWVAIKSVIIQATRFTAAGVELTAAADYPNNYVLASEVVADLLGRWLTQYDGAGAVIETTTHQITQFSYPDGVDQAKPLADLMLLEGGYTWRVWERNTAGKFRFEWVAVPADVRYEADVNDGYDAPGSADGIFNAVTVRWRDSGGHIRTTTRTSTAPELTAADLTRQGQIDLGDEVGTQADAERAGDQWLADRRYAPNAGRLRIARRIIDLQTGRMVQPWEIEPGLIRVRGILPSIDALNTSSRDGTTIFRIRALEFRASDAAATLELDSYAPSTARALADLQRRPVYRRR
jgi:hypothetical protein